MKKNWPLSEEQQAIAEELAKDPGYRTLIRWFFAVNIPIVVLLTVFNHWRNAVVGQPLGIGEAVLRAVVGFIAFYIGVLILFKKLILPALQRAKTRIAENDGSRESR